MKLSFRHYYWRWLKNLIFLFILFAVLMTLARGAFALYFGDANTLIINSHELKKAFWLGFRFDLMPLAYINAIPFLLLNLAYFIRGRFAIMTVRFMIITILTVGYFAIAWLYIFDYGFYSYFQDHMNVLVFGFFEDDTKALLISIYKNYHLTLWLLILSFLHYGLFKLIKFMFSPFDFDLKAKPFSIMYPVSFLTGLVLLPLMGRGNYSRLPLSLEDAHISNNEFVNEIALNGALTLNRAIKIRKTFGTGKVDYLRANGFTSWQEALGVPFEKQDLIAELTVKTPANDFLKQNPPHVILVVMESFGSYWNSYDGENFNIMGELNSHFKDGYLFNNFLPAENGTIGSIVSVATGQVIRPGARFLSESEFMKTPLKSAGHLPFKQNGYETHFVYGGKLGWRDLGKYLSDQGYDRLWGADEIREAMPELNNFSERDLGNEWGIFDEYLYTFIDEQIRTATKPQFFLVLTTSNHPPFEYPSSYQPLKLDLTKDFLQKVTVSEDMAQKRFLGLQYANQKMGEFLTKIKKSKLNDNTIVALTGDHSFWIAKGVEQDQEFKRYAVPFFLRIPDAYKPQSLDTNKFGSHEDIFPTLFHLSLSNTSYVKLGDNLISDSSIALNSSGLIADRRGAYHHGKFWKWVDPNLQILEETPSTPELEELKRRGLGLIGVTDAYLKSEETRKPSDAKNGQQ